VDDANLRQENEWTMLNSINESEPKLAKDMEEV
jgi:hypothetical protein